VSSVESSSTWISRRSRGQSSAHAAAMIRAATACSLKIGSCTVTTGSAASSHGGTGASGRRARAINVRRCTAYTASAASAVR
jgi:hypothetical protein